MPVIQLAADRGLTSKKDMVKFFLCPVLIVCSALPVTAGNSIIDFRTSFGYSYLAMNDLKEFIRLDGGNRSGNIQLARSVSIGANVNLTRKLSLSFEVGYLLSKEENEVWITLIDAFGNPLGREKVATRKDSAFAFPITANFLVEVLSKSICSLKLGGGIGYYLPRWKIEVAYSGLLEDLGARHYEHEGSGAGLQGICEFYININRWLSAGIGITGRFTVIEFPNLVVRLDFSGIEGNFGILFHIF